MAVTLNGYSYLRGTPGLSPWTPTAGFFCILMTYTGGSVIFRAKCFC